MFKVGDKIRRTATGIGIIAGSVYTVTKALGDDIMVKEASGWWFADFFKLVEEPKTKRPHDALIRAWLDGAEIEFQTTYGTWLNAPTPEWRSSANYRLKPEVKPDVVLKACVANGPFGLSYATGFSNRDNVAYTFDGETGKLKSVEIL